MSRELDRTIVDADNGEILYCHQMVQTVAARGNVYRVDGDRGCTSSFSSPIETLPERTVSTLWLPNNGFQPTPKSGTAEVQPLYAPKSYIYRDFRRISGMTK